MGQAKMAGSVGNVVNIADLLQKHSAETVRFQLLNTHYRSPIEYSDERLVEMRRSLEGFYRFFERLERISGESFYRLPGVKVDDKTLTKLGTLRQEVEPLWKKFHENMQDDFNTAGGIGAMHELLSALNRFADHRGLETAK